MRWVALAAVLFVIAGCGGGGSSGSLSFATQKVDGLTLPARVEGKDVEVASGGKFVPLFWSGVNLGSTVPGHQPGEVAATRADYDRWLPGIAALGARTIRIYTILRPSFYDALAAYNAAHPDAPLFFIQGVWIPEDEFLASGNAYEPAVTNGFKSEIDHAVAVVHGDATIPELPGHAGGTYRSDVSRWLLAYSIGVEWDPHAVESTDKLNVGTPPFHGKYFTAKDTATPMESWLASMLEHTAADEAARGWSRPLTFTNWLTLDPLHHPYEPLPQEDLVSVDATHISATEAWPGGFFASYHAYPYYPDFLRLTPSYQQYKRSDGVVDPYAGYLHELRAYHGNQAVMITEFGVPSALGIAHYGPAGRNQGNHTEQESMAMDAEMLRDIHDEGYAGGMVFEWTDEWFKFTWNTIELELPHDRRQLWRNDLTNEEHFGILSTDPGKTPVVVLDGKAGEWGNNGSQVIAESDGPVRQVRAVKDEQSLYLMLRLASKASWRKDRIVVGLDVRPGSNKGLPDSPGVYPQADVAFVVGPGETADLMQAAWWEPTRIVYGLGLGMIKVDPAAMKQGSGVWVRPLQMLNKPYTVPATGEKRPAETHEIGPLPFGDGDPASPAYDERALVSASGSVVEIRLPWALLGFSDPSSLTLYDAHPDATFSTSHAGRIGIAVETKGGPLLTTSGYAWEPWQSVTYHERRKAGFDVLAKAMTDLSRPD